MLAARLTCLAVVLFAAVARADELAIAPLDPKKLADFGLREVRGKHLTLVTDLPKSDAIDALPALFDQAVPQWCAYFDVSTKTAEPWRMRGYLMGDRRKFVEAGLLDDLPDFAHGYARGLELWLNEQPGEYYRRHLLLHEGTHAFMFAFLGNCGPPWYMEGMAELLATHRLTDGKLELNRLPRTRDDAPDLGRIKLVQDAVKADRLPSVPEIMNYAADAHRNNETYAMSWALCALLDGAPRYQHRFRELRKIVKRADFNEAFKQAFAHDWNELLDDWSVFARGLVYGYDVERAAIQFTPPKQKEADGSVKMQADRGWQSTGITVEADKKYRVKAEGRYAVGDQPKPWVCEPQGVSIRYVDGRPLGVVLAAVRGKTKSAAAPNFLAPLVVGREATFTPTESGTLFVRINDSPAELADNSGTFAIRVETAD